MNENSYAFVLVRCSGVKRIFAGFGLAALLAVSLGLFVGRSRLIADIFMSPLEVLRPIPAVAWIPLAILMFVSPEGSMIFITFIGAFFPILLSTIHGVARIDRRLIFAAMTLGASPVAVFLEVILPGALPAIVTGLSIGMGTSWFSLVTAEMISGQYGIGYYTWEAYTLQNYPDIVLGMISFGLLGNVCNASVRRALSSYSAERRRFSAGPRLFEMTPVHRRAKIAIPHGLYRNSILYCPKSYGCDSNRFDPSCNWRVFPGLRSLEPKTREKPIRKMLHRP